MGQVEHSRKSVMQRFLDGVEKVGNLVPHPVLIFVILILIVIALSHLLASLEVGVTFEAIVPNTTSEQTETPEYDPRSYETGGIVQSHAMDEKSYTIEERTVAARSLLTAEGIRFIYISLIPSFMGFTAVGLMIAAMIGAGVAEESGLVNTLIRKLVILSPTWALIYILSFVGICLVSLPMPDIWC